MPFQSGLMPYLLSLPDELLFPVFRFVYEGLLKEPSAVREALKIRQLHLRLSTIVPAAAITYLHLTPTFKPAEVRKLQIATQRFRSRVVLPSARKVRMGILKRDATQRSGDQYRNAPR
jgi:hypothetical protein